MSSTEPKREWVGGRMTLPARIEPMGDRRAEMTLWVELPDLHIVGQMLEDPEDPQASFGQSLMRAMASPLVGEPRRPQRVRVADAALAEQLKSFSFLSVEVAPTPEFDKVVRSVAAFFGEGSYFTDPSLTPDDVEQFFLGSKLLWSARPWTLTSDEALVHIEVPALGIEDGCVSIVGSLGHVRGFVFFPSYEDFERMTESAGRVERGEPLATHRALYLSLDPQEDVPEAMRKEAAEHGWPLADEQVYPMLLSVADGKHAPVIAPDLKLATALTHALGAFATRHPEALKNYGEVEVRESHVDEGGLEVIVSVPHPSSDEAFEDPLPARAMTLDDTPNPYGLPLESNDLEQLERLLGAFTLHRAIGLFCATVSVPELPSPSVWLGEIMRHVELPDERQAGDLMGWLMAVYQHVVSTIEQHDVDGLIPEPADEEACGEWARGYATLLDGVDPAHLKGDAAVSAFAIHALGGNPQALRLVDELRGDASRDSMLAGYRESLADDAACLLDAWAEARAAPTSRPAEATFRREAPKVGRNDPCPCGSGKKYKKCCAVN